MGRLEVFKEFRRNLLDGISKALLHIVLVLYGYQYSNTTILPFTWVPS